jgi:type IV secretory pathway protease TraF
LIISTTINVKNQAVAATIITVGVTIASGATATLTGASTGVTSPITYRWYASQEAETPLHTGPTFTTPTLTTSTTYYVSVEGSDYCENAPGDRKAVTVAPLSAITVNPVNNLVNCIGMQIPATAFSSPLSGVTYKWTNSNPAIGLAASGTGNQPAFTAAQVGSATITVTPYLGATAGVSRTYTIKVSSCVLPVNPHLMIWYKE